MTANTFPAAQTSLPSSPPAGAHMQPPRLQSRRVVDATTRMLHWLMALSFTGAYLTADGERWRLVHMSLGYTLAGLLTARVLWGLFGPRQARLAMLLRKLQGLPGWLKSLPNAKSFATAQAAWRLGQNLMMALVVVLILGAVVPLTLSGYAVWAEWGGEWLEDMHELFGNALLMMVLAHIGLIVLTSLLRRKNQALPMLTGRVPGSGPDLAKRNHGFLAALVLACVIGFWSWQWSNAPQNTSADAAQLDNRRNQDSD